MEMPVIRISDRTWVRLKAHATPLEDTTDDVIRRALDALDLATGKATASKVVAEMRRRPAEKTAQKSFRKPLLETLVELGGAGAVPEIRHAMERKLAAQLKPGDFAPVSTGEPRWWNAVCWERNECVKAGLFEKPISRGYWEISTKGRMLASGGAL